MTASSAAEAKPPLVTASPFQTRQTRLQARIAAYDCEINTRANRLFTWLLPAQWLFAIVVAIIWSSTAWRGSGVATLTHVTVAAGGGAVLTLGPLVLAWLRPQHPLTRHVIGIAQVGFSTLLIHLTAGRIETHFHVFGSLAFLTLYRDWRVVMSATLVVVADHFVRGLWFPWSVFCEPTFDPWRPLEHAAWVVFEDIVLVWACIVSRREMREICVRQDQNEELRDELEHRVRTRTAALEAAAEEQRRIGERLRVSEERHRQLVTNAPIGIFKSLRDGRVRIANPYLLELVGLPPDCDLGQLDLSRGQIFPAAARERFWQRLENEREVRGFTTQLHRVDGTPVEVIFNARLVPSPVPDVLACEGTVEDVTEARRAARQLEQVHRELLATSRQAGMAEVANGVLHNVGNILTSVNLTLQEARERLQRSRVPHLQRAAEALARERDRLAEFLTADAAGRQLPDFLARLAEHLATENQRLAAELENVGQHFDHIREIVVTQQDAARVVGVLEQLDPAALFEEALRLTARALERHTITVERDFTAVGEIRADRHKVLQILVNLIQNAKDATSVRLPGARQLQLRVAPGVTPGTAQLAVTDNGSGIAPEHRARLFQHGFTTKPDGHGFGLHSCALAARELQGELAVDSAGPDQGATFTLTLPLAPPPAS